MEHQQPSRAAAADARAAAGREAAPAAAPSGAGERLLGPCAWVAAIRDSPQVQAQRRVIQGVFGDSARRPGAAGRSGAPLQAKRITGLPLGARQAGPNSIWIGDGQIEVDSFWKVMLGTKDTRAQLIQAAAQTAARLGREIDAIVRGDWNLKPDEVGQEGNRYFDPLRVRCVGDYGGHPIELDFHFGNKFSGYVVRVHDPEAGIDDQAMNANPKTLDAATEYGHVHEVDDRPRRPILDTPGADAVTKLAGEGARWQCIGDNIGAMRDDTRIYTNENADDAISPNVRFIDFPTLWKSWAATFDKEYGIADEKVVPKLRQPEVKIQTMKGEEARAVGVASSTSMDHGIDVCVDKDKPAAQADLDLVSVQTLRFTIGRGKVFDLNQPLEDHVDAMADRVRGIPGLDYLDLGACTGAKTFEFVCKRTGKQPPVLEGYAIEAKDDEVRYPMYREKQVAGKFPRVFAPPEQEGKAAYLAMMESAYDYRLGQLVDYVDDNYVTTGLQGLEALIRSQLLVWGGTLDDELPDHEEYTGGGKDAEIRKVLDAAKPKAVTTNPADSSDEDEPAQQPEPRKGGKGGKGGRGDKGAKSSGKKSSKSKK